MHNKPIMVTSVQKYTIYFLQGFEKFISFRAYGPSGNKLLKPLQEINLYISSQKSQ